jgi:phosphotriesterase-related protein
MSVETVRGPVDVADLGQTLMHEHVFVLGTEIRQNYPDFPSPWDEEARVADAIAKLTACTERGIDTIVDPTVIGLGRYIPRIQRINDYVDINIIAATGIYTYNDANVTEVLADDDCRRAKARLNGPPEGLAFQFVDGRIEFANDT